MIKRNAPKGANVKSLHNNSTEAQRQRLLRALTSVGGEGLTTIQLREQYDIMAPAPRIFELRWNLGHNIQTIRDKDSNAQGNIHSTARYVLLSGAWKGVAA